MIGRTLSHYRITGKLGAGGMGEVYLATDTQLERRVALKVLPAEVAADPERLGRLQREAKALAALDHPNIVGVFSIEEAEGVHFLTMAHIEGKTLEEVIPPGGLPTKRFFELAVPLADAIRAAHESGIVHRDLKPSNIMIDREGRLRVLDFGLARIESQPASPDMSQLSTQAMTRVGAVLGSYPYMSPEQIEGKVADARSDIFSMGVVLYRMATGERPFQGDTAASLISSILRDTPPLVTETRKNLPGQLGRIIRRCLEKNPNRRIQSAQDLRRELQDLAQEVASGRAWTVRATPTDGFSRTATRRLAAVAVVGALVILTGVYAWWSQRPPPEAQAPRIASLAVLPLENFTGDTEQDYLVDGMTDALIADLSKIGSLAVISRTTAMRYKKTEKSLPEIARELNVDGVVEGSVMREAETLRIRASLIDGDSDRRLWSDSFSRDLTGVLSLQGDIARAIAEAIDVTLTPQEESRLTASREVDPETYQAYLRGMFWLNKGTAEGIEKGMAFLHQAVERDPGDALAYAGLALGYITVAHGPVPPEDALNKAKSAAVKAVRLDANLAEAHAALGFIEGYYEWQWEQAQRSIDRALEINPSLAIAHYHDAWFHVLFGRWEESIEAHKRAQELDPLTPNYTSDLGLIYEGLGRYDEAIAEAEKSIQMNPSHPRGYMVLGNVFLDRGMADEAVVEYEKAALAPPWRWVAGIGYAAAGREQDARRLVAELEALPDEPWKAFWLARLHTALGDLDEAFRWLNYESPHAWVPWIRNWNWFEPLRGDPRFEDLLRRMNLPPA